ncbi:MAG: hypothetical protein ACO3SY_02740 [Flavobacteriaceae bacterium]|jgi:hypothetical protein
MNKQKQQQQYTLWWRLIVLGVVVLGIASVSPWLIQPNKVEPYWLGMPFALWTSILLTLLIIGLTALGGLVFTKKQELKRTNSSDTL